MAGGFAYAERAGSPPRPGPAPTDMRTALTMRPVRRSTSFALGSAGRTALRWALLILGGFLVLLGVALAPLPGPMGLPVTLIGLMLVLRNSFRARRAFIRFQRRHPRIVFPLRRLLRRDPQIVSLAYQQVLRVERLILPADWRKTKELRRRFFRRARVRA